MNPDGSAVYITGYTASEDCTVAYSPVTGTRLWAAFYTAGKGTSNNASAIAVSPDGSTVFITGESSSRTGPGYYVTVAYNAATGAMLWEENYSTPLNSDATAVAVSPDSKTVFVTGSILDYYATVAYNATTGTRLWVARYRATAMFEPSGATSLAVSPDGATVFVTGHVITAASGTDYGTVAYNAATGAAEWNRHYATPAGENYPQAIAVSPDGSTVFVQGFSENAALTADDYATVAYSAVTGATVWVRRYPDAGTVARNLAVSPDGSKVFVTGTSTTSTGVACYATVAYAAATGNRLWTTRYLARPVNAYTSAAAIAVSPDGSKVFVTGSSGGSSGQPDYGTVADNAVSGAKLWAARYSAPGGQQNEATALAVSPDGSKVFVTGQAAAPNGHLVYVTIAYSA